MENTATEYYVVKNSDGLLELRQTRFKKSFYDKGLNHSHDICAVARDVDEMKAYFKHWGGTTLSGSVDFSLVED